MKGFSYPGKSPIQKNSKKVKGNNSIESKPGLVVNEYYEKSKQAGEITVDDLLRSIGASPENE